MILENVKKILDKNKWPYNELEDGNLYIDVLGKNGSWTSYTKIIEEEYQFNFYSSLNLKVPEEKIGKVMELITRINFSLKNGNFELNIDNGELRFKTTISFAKEHFDEVLIEKVPFFNKLRTSWRLQSWHERFQVWHGLFRHRC